MLSSLRVRLTMIFIGLAIVPLILTSFLIAYRSCSTVEAQSLATQRQAARQVSTQLGTFSDLFEHEFALPDSLYALASRDRDAQRIALQDFVQHSSIDREAVLVTVDGKEQIPVARFDVPTETPPPNWSGRVEFAVPGTYGGFYCGEVVFHQKIRQPLITLYRASTDPASRDLVAMVVARLKFRDIWNFLKDVELPRNEDIYLSDISGLAIAHRDPTIVMNSTRFELPSDDGWSRALTGADAFLVRDTLRVGSTYSTMVAEQPAADALRLGTDIMWRAASVTPSSLLIATVLGILTVRRTVSPIENLADSAHAISRGNYSHQVAVSGRDQVSELASAFDSMRIQLQESLSALAQEITIRKDTEVMLQQDIAQRVWIEEEILRLLKGLREQVRLVHQIMDSVPEGMLLLDQRAPVILTSRTALAKADVGDILSGLGDQPITQLLVPPAQPGRSHEVSSQFPPNRVSEIIAQPMEEGTESGGHLVVIRDVTEERHLQQRAEKQERLAVVSRLPAGIAHDFNNLISSVILYASMMLRSSDLSPTDRGRFETVCQQELAADLTQQIFDFGRSAVLQSVDLNLVDFVHGLQTLLQHSLTRKIRLVLSSDRDEIMVHADPGRLQQVILNLTIKAREAMPDGGDFRIDLTGPTPDGWVRLIVSDTGVGIPADVLPQIFEPFFTTKAPQGSRLRLSQVYGIVKQHDGDVTVSSRLGVATTFTISLPASQLSEPSDPV
jgi:signal transduction histidine kinase/HAMP domain-containing protein